MSFFNFKGKDKINSQDKQYVKENADFYAAIDKKASQIKKHKKSSTDKKNAIKIMDADFAKDLLITKDVAALSQKIKSPKYKKVFTKSYDITPEEILAGKKINHTTPYELVLLLENLETGEIEEKELDSNTFTTIPKYMKLAENLKRKNEKLSLYDIQNIHGEYFSKTIREDLNGCFRREDITLHNVNYAPPSSYHVKQEMENLLEEFNNSKIHPIEKIALLHLGIIGIQPFPDGNKKTARIVANVLLHQYGYPTITAMEYDCKAYRDIVCDSLETQDSTPIVTYIANRVNDSCDKQLDILRGIKKEKVKDIEIVQ